MRIAFLALLAGLALAGCGEEASQPVARGMGPQPSLPPPRETWLPTINIAPARGWAAGEAPTPAQGLRVAAFAEGLDHPRQLLVLPNGDVLVAETNGPKRPEDAKGIRGWVQRRVQGWAGAGTPSANRITLLRDADGDGVAETRSVFLADLNSPFGLTLLADTLYIADTDALLAVPYRAGETRAAASPRKVTDLPGGPLNHHWTKNVIAGPDGKLYVAVGSNSNVAENGIEAEHERAAVWQVDPATGAHRVYTAGTRNPVGLAVEPATRAVWVAVNERDEIGSDLVPDYMTALRDGGFFGWPWSYYGQHVDARVQPPNPAMVARAVPPDYALGPHTASLGLAFAPERGGLPAPFDGGAFVGQHGSWNRRPPSGYKVIYVPFQGGRPSGEAVDVLTGFLDQGGNARGRPVGVAPDGRGGLLVADDVGNRVWRVSAAQGIAQR